MTRRMTVMNDLIDEISMGPFGSDITIDNYKGSGIPVLNGSNISGVKLTESFKNFVTPDKAKSLKKANAKRGDIVITHRGTLGQVAYIPYDSNFDGYIISQSQFRLSLKKDLVDPVYFTYYFHTTEGQKRLLSFKNHVGVPALAQATTNFKLLEFPYRELTEQKAIASVLSSLDSKIELNNKSNTELEAMAKLIYDYWFVQFDFPISAAQATALGKPELKGKPYKASGGPMVYNQALKREIPEGWEVGELNDIANITMGQSPPGESYNENGEGSVFYQGCTDFGTRFPTVRKYTTQPTRYASSGDILLSVRAPVGAMNIATEDCCIGRGLAALNSKDNSEAYLCEVLKYFKQIFDRRNTDGTTFGAITKNDLFSLPVVIPKNGIINSFQEKIGSAYQKLNQLEKENQELSSLRDWLLPMLMNGQVTIKEAEERVSMAAEPEEAYGDQN